VKESRAIKSESDKKNEERRTKDDDHPRPKCGRGSFIIIAFPAGFIHPPLASLPSFFALAIQITDLHNGYFPLPSFL